MISTIILTYNSQKQISQCLKNLQWSDEIIVIDNYSSDNTIAVVKRLGIKFFRRSLNNDFSSQRNFGISKAKGDWIFFVDTDEIVSSRLRSEIKNIIAKKPIIDLKYACYQVKRQDWFLGKKMKFGENGANWFIRLGRKNCGLWKGQIHEVWQTKKSVGKLRGKLIHRQEDTVDSFLDKINYYSDIRAQEIFKKGQRFNFLKLWLWPTGKFIYNYFLRLGFLDGSAGLIQALLMSLYSLAVRIKLYEIEKR